MRIYELLGGALWLAILWFGPSAFTTFYVRLGIPVFIAVLLGFASIFAMAFGFVWLLVFFVNRKK